MTADSPHKKLSDTNRCLTDPANRCFFFFFFFLFNGKLFLTDINRYYISYSTYPVLVIFNQKLVSINR